MAAYLGILALSAACMADTQAVEIAVDTCSPICNKLVCIGKNDLGIAMALVSVGSLIYFIHHVAESYR